MDAPSCQGCRERDARIAELEARLAEVEARLQEQARLIVDLAKKLQDRDLPKSGTPGPPDAYVMRVVFAFLFVTGLELIFQFDRLFARH